MQADQDTPVLRRDTPDGLTVLLSIAVIRPLAWNLLSRHGAMVHTSSLYGPIAHLSL